MKVELTKIRKAEESDLKAINAIARQVHDLHVELRPDIYVSTDEVIPAELFREILRNGLFFVGEVDEVIISYAVCVIRIWDNPVQTKQKIMFVDALGNDRKYQHCGIGTQMMDYIIDYAKKEGCSRLELQVTSANQVALEFYQKLNMRIKAQIMELEL